MISYQHDPTVDPEHGGLYLPIVVCDACSRPIVGSGNAYWLVRVEDGEVHPQVWHTHKHPCSKLDDELERQHPGHASMWEELDRWLDQLRHNFEAGTGRV